MAQLEPIELSWARKLLKEHCEGLVESLPKFNKKKSTVIDVLLYCIGASKALNLPDGFHNQAMFEGWIIQRLQQETQRQDLVAQHTADDGTVDWPTIGYYKFTTVHSLDEEPTDDEPAPFCSRKDCPYDDNHKAFCEVRSE